MIPRLSKSVCGISLYTGSLILAWMSVITSLTGIMVLFFVGPIFFAEIGEEEKNSDSQMELSLIAAKMTYALVLAVLILSTVLSCCLLYGIYKRNHCLIMPHVIVSGFGVCMAIFGNIFFLLKAFSSFDDFLDCVTHLFESALTLYFWLIVFSFYLEVKEQAEGEQSSTVDKL